MYLFISHRVLIIFLLMIVAYKINSKLSFPEKYAITTDQQNKFFSIPECFRISQLNHLKDC